MLGSSPESATIWRTVGWLQKSREKTLDYKNIFGRGAKTRQGWNSVLALIPSQLLVHCIHRRTLESNRKMCSEKPDSPPQESTKKGAPSKVVHSCGFRQIEVKIAKQTEKQAPVTALFKWRWRFFRGQTHMSQHHLKRTHRWTRHTTQCTYSPAPDRTAH